MFSRTFAHVFAPVRTDTTNYKADFGTESLVVWFHLAGCESESRRRRFHLTPVLTFLTLTRLASSPPPLLEPASESNPTPKQSASKSYCTSQVNILDAWSVYGIFELLPEFSLTSSDLRSCGFADVRYQNNLGSLKYALPALDWSRYTTFRRDQV